MKIKLDFVTNSSSTHFLVTFKEEITEETLLDYGMTPRHVNEVYSISDIEQLISHVQQKECTWVDRVTGPCRFWGECKEWYNIAKVAIQEGLVPTFISLERGTDDEEILDRVISELGAKLVDRMSD